MVPVLVEEEHTHLFLPCEQGLHACIDVLDDVVHVTARVAVDEQSIVRNSPVGVGFGVVLSLLSLHDMSAIVPQRRMAARIQRRFFFIVFYCYYCSFTL